MPDAVRPVSGLSQSTRQGARAIAQALFATDEGTCPDHRLDWLDDELAHFFAQAGARARFSFWLCVTAISIVAPWFVGSLRPLRALPEAHRAEAIERMEKSPFALPIFGAKAVLCILYYEHPEAAAKIGFDATCLKAVSS